MMISFSLIVCTRGRPLMLERLLCGIALLRYPRFELIVICDPADRITGECLALHAPRAKIGHCATANLARARNTGLSMSAGDILAFIDDDAVPYPDWLDRLAVAYDRPEIAAAGGFIRKRDGAAFQSRFVRIDPFGADHHSRHLPRRMNPGWFLSLTGTNFSVRRHAALALQGFDENYPYYLEETDFLLRLRAAGGEIRMVDNAEVCHDPGPSETRTAHGAPKSLLTIARSKAYYCHVNRRFEISTAAIHFALARFMLQKCWRIGALILMGRLHPGNAARLFKELRTGLREGKTLASHPRLLPEFRGNLLEFANYRQP